ncbi:hypothetical protein A6M21_06795 [Desulfotomaculum copahuensis]|uniref:Uncharacterized protein n=2 Tax=Desulfotomaculum copahuensis TaxID=1838280 RepID=A0A1B7LGN0_9FIRM|nr:hypothetical protein A6M21_06795 [Desulfotomaculum copahuensis]
MKINAIENGSAMNIGQNFLAEWNSVAKRNEGTGSNYGDETCFAGMGNLVDDADFMDQPFFKEPLIAGPKQNMLKGEGHCL